MPIHNMQHLHLKVSFVFMTFVTFLVRMVALHYYKQLLKIKLCFMAFLAFLVQMVGWVTPEWHLMPRCSLIIADCEAPRTHRLTSGASRSPVE